MAESTRARQNRAAKQKANGREGQKMARETRYATRANLAESQGPPVIPVDLPFLGLRVLMRRPNLLQLLNANTFPEPITGMVRQLMLDGIESVETDYARERFEEMALGLVRSLAIVPPPELLDDSITVDQVTPDMFRPLFVAPGEECGPDQMVLAGPLDEVWGDNVCRVASNDIRPMLYQMMVARVGAASWFRGSGQEQTSAVEAGDAVEGDGANVPAVEAAAA